jgi:predicted RND superfamily exporter protein
MQQININTQNTVKQIKSNQNNTQMQHKNNKFKQTSTPLIVVCLCHDDGATPRQWQP